MTAAAMDAKMGGGTGRQDGPNGETNNAAKTPDPDAMIGARLKALYQELEQEPVPDLFIDLLERLDEAEAFASGDASRHYR